VSSDPDLTYRRRRWSGLLGLLVVIAFVALLGWYWKFPTKQTGTVFAILRVGALPAATGTTPDKSESRREEVYRQTQANLLRTRAVLERALQKAAALDLSLVREQPQPLAWLEKELRVEAQSTTKTITIAMSGDRPAERAQLVNAVVHAYLSEFVETEDRDQHDRVARCESIIKQQSEQFHQQLDKLQKALRQLGGDGRAARWQQQAAMDRTANLEQELDAKSAQLEKAQVQLDFERKKARAPEADKVPDATVDDYLSRDPAALQLAAQIGKLRRMLASYEDSARGGPAASELVKSSLKGYRTDLTAAQQQFDQRRTEIRKRLAKLIQETSQQNLKQLEEQVALLKEEEQRLRQQLDKHLKGGKALADRSSEDVDDVAKDIERKLETIKRFTEECDAARKELQQRPQVMLVLEARWAEP
jgi:hypothetical protein